MHYYTITVSIGKQFRFVCYLLGGEISKRFSVNEAVQWKLRINLFEYTGLSNFLQRHLICCCLWIYIYICQKWALRRCFCFHPSWSCVFLYINARWGDVLECKIQEHGYIYIPLCWSHLLMLEWYIYISVLGWVKCCRWTKSCGIDAFSVRFRNAEPTAK